MKRGGAIERQLAIARAQQRARDHSGAVDNLANLHDLPRGQLPENAQRRGRFDWLRRWLGLQRA